jgi:hypothetical protein
MARDLKASPNRKYLQNRSAIPLFGAARHGGSVSDRDADRLGSR